MTDHPRQPERDTHEAADERAARDADLLAWVEGDAAPDVVARVQALVAADPGLGETLRAMQADRHALRAMDAPALPVDFVTAMETDLARPMLFGNDPVELEIQPGAWRKRHRVRRQRRVLPWATAAAAVLLLGIGFGVRWQLGLSQDGGDGNEMLADAGEPAGDPNDGVAVTRVDQTPDVLATDEGRTLIHGHPTPLSPEMIANANVGDDSDFSLASSSATDQPVPAQDDTVIPVLIVSVGDGVDNVSMAGVDDSFAAVLRSAVEAGIGMDADEAEVAVIRNLSPTMLRAMAGEPGAPDALRAAMGGTARPDAGDFDRAFGARYDSSRRSPEVDRVDADRPGVIAGASMLRTPWLEQLELAERGADWTVVLPAEDVAEFMHAFSQACRGGVRLGALSRELDGDDAAVDAGTEAWRTQAQQLRLLRDRTPDALVRLAISVRRAEPS